MRPFILPNRLAYFGKAARAGVIVPAGALSHVALLTRTRGLRAYGRLVEEVRVRHHHLPVSSGLPAPC